MILPTVDALIARARELAPTLLERADAADRLGRLQDETVRDLVDSELVKVMVPARHGGFELDWQVGARILEELGKGCGSTAWVMNAYLCTTWVAATFPEAAQREVFGDKGYGLGPCPMNPRLGRARRVEGGYQVTLRAPFGSGVVHSEWAVLCANLDPEGTDPAQVPLAPAPAAVPSAPVPHAPVPLVMLVPRKDYSFDLASWSVLGMRGTGSATITMQDAFVPEHRVMHLSRLGDGSSPGAQTNPAPMYRVPYISGFVCMAAGVLVGMARHGLEAFEKLVRSRVYAMTGQAQSAALGSQMRLGEASAYIGAAAALYQSDLQELMTRVDKETLSIADRVRFRLDSAYEAYLCRQAIDCIKDGAGANALRDGTALQRIYRDIHMISANFGYQMDYMKELQGRALLGLPIDVNEV